MLNIMTITRVFDKVVTILCFKRLQFPFNLVSDDLIENFQIKKINFYEKYFH